MRDILDELTAVHRETGHGRIPAGEGRTVVLRRRYDAEIDDVWDAITDPERINRWFMPVTGELKVGGSYQLKGNAGGEILRCEPPRLLKVTWVFGENPTEKDVTEVEVRLAPGGDGATEFELVHTAVVPEEMWSQYGPGATGVGWDLSLLGLSMHLRGESIPDHEEFESSPEAREFSTRSSQAWGESLRASGASDEQVAAAVQATTQFYAPSA
ncbi:SRPBCC family protein [Phytohabitans rumicis]|uniref:Activator of HSP90 ATPase n=1 Tax=Phytohabitans rumicis TaxID=1076125 RepID=A0A6V8LAY7_9ACTN|nr:SRPBCC family protein [Phytohabitans rumicis]GFJ94372.1 activator of HSP90 ATPase [Phytohabitans rumicis]